jgi:hypothetical protein
VRLAARRQAQDCNHGSNETSVRSELMAMLKRLSREHKRRRKMNGPSAGGHAEAVLASDAWGAPGIRVTLHQVIPAVLVPPPRHDDRGKRRPPGLRKNGPGEGAIFR